MHPTISILGFDIDSYMVFTISAAVSAAVLSVHELRRNGYGRSVYVTLLLAGTVGGILGSKIYYIVVTWDEFILSPYGYLTRFGGFAWYGGLIFGILSMIMVISSKKLPILKTLDVIVPAIPLGLAIGRMGCFLAGCCHGVPSGVPWAMSFSEGLYAGQVKVHPTQLYEMAISLGIFYVLWRLRDRDMWDGTKFGLYLVLAGAGRFVVEFYRCNPRVIYVLTAPHLISAASILTGTAILGGAIRYSARHGNVRIPG